MDAGDEIARHLRTAAASVAVPHAVPERAHRRARTLQRRRRAATGTVTALLVLAGVAAVGVATTRDPARTTVADTGPSPTATVARAQAVLVDPPTSWTVTEGGVVPGSLARSTVTADGIVAVEESQFWDDADAVALWRSRDGRSWEEVRLPVGVLPLTAAQVGERLVVTGIDQSRSTVAAGVLLVSDDGASWEEVPLTATDGAATEPRPLAVLPLVAAGPDRVTLVTSISATTGGAMRTGTTALRSTDGRTFTPVALPGTDPDAEGRPPAGGSAPVVVGGPGGFALVSELGGPVWRSRDGLVWAPAGPVPFVGATIDAGMVGDQLVVLLRADDDGRVAAARHDLTGGWTVLDGWQGGRAPVTDQPTAPQVNDGGVSFVEDRTATSGEAALAHSVDGTTWTQEDLDAVTGARGVSLRSTVAVDGTLVVTGVRPDGSTVVASRPVRPG